MSDESMFESLDEDALLEVSGGCWHGCGGHCGRRISTTAIAAAPVQSGYSLSTIPGAPGAPGSYGAQVQPGGFAGSVKVVTRSYGAHRFHR